MPAAARVALAGALASLLLLLAASSLLSTGVGGGSNGAALLRRASPFPSSSHHHLHAPPLQLLPPFQPTHDLRPLCADTCPYANNGICDEGRAPRAEAVDGPLITPAAATIAAAGAPDPRPPHLVIRCDLGTDCADCGPWPGGARNTSAWQEADAPVAFLRRAGYELRARRAAVSVGNGDALSFWFAYADPVLDVDVSRQAQDSGAVEPGLTALAVRALRPARQSGNNDGTLLIDVGANFGWYSLLAASLGCRAVAWEPVPRFRAYLEWSLARNNLVGLVQVRPAAVAEHSTHGARTLEVVAGNRGVWGTAGLAGANLDPGVENNGALERVSVAGERLRDVARELVARGLLRGAAAIDDDDGSDASAPFRRRSFIYPRVDFLKIDVEGGEAAAVKSAGERALLPFVRAAAVEVSPGVHERAGDWSRASEPTRMLLRLMRAMGGGGGGAAALHLEDDFVRGRAAASILPSSSAADASSSGPASSSQPPLPPTPLREVLPYSLAHDLADARRMSAAGSGAAPLPGEGSEGEEGDDDDAGGARSRAPACLEMRKGGLPMRGIPESLHPCSFRSTFGHNTNVLVLSKQAVEEGEIVRAGEWAAEAATTLGCGGQAMRASSSSPSSSPTPPLPWFVPVGQDAGMGGRFCSSLARDVLSAAHPAEDSARIVVAHRCRCPTADAAADTATNAPWLQACRALESAAEGCARRGESGFRALSDGEARALLEHDARREAAEGRVAMATATAKQQHV